jgi:hypothetical protein
LKGGSVKRFVHQVVSQHVRQCIQSNYHQNLLLSTAVGC